MTTDSASLPPSCREIPSPWHGGWLSPLNIAAYVTWLATLLQSLDAQALRDAQAREWIGLALLCGMLVGYVAAERLGERAGVSTQRALALLQGACTLAAGAVLREGGTTVLLIIVAAQVVALWPQRQALAVMVGVNAIQVMIWAQFFGWTTIVLYLLPMIGFQVFAGLTMHYAMSAEQARERADRINAELLATQRLLEDSARSGERLRLSRELHDVAGHKLTALRLNLRLLSRDAGFAGREELATCEALAQELLSDIRAVVSELREHDGLDLAAAIAALARPIPGTQFDIDIDPGLRVERVDQAETLLRCAQEGITNALRHGRARRIELSCRRERERFALVIRNDGSMLRTTTFGNGLTGMRERLDSAGGSLSLRALPDGGAELVALLPAAA